MQHGRESLVTENLEASWCGDIVRSKQGRPFAGHEASSKRSEPVGFVCLATPSLNGNLTFVVEAWRPPRHRLFLPLFPHYPPMLYQIIHTVFLLKLPEWYCIAHALRPIFTIRKEDTWAMGGSNIVSFGRCSCCALVLRAPNNRSTST